MSEICLCCKATAPITTEHGEVLTTGDEIMEFHDIFDEVGLELQLPLLVEKYYGLKVQDDTSAASTTSTSAEATPQTHVPASTTAASIINTSNITTATAPISEDASHSVVAETAVVKSEAVKKLKNPESSINDSKRKLCADCMNRLIELLDLEEHNNELFEKEDQLQQQSHSVSTLSTEVIDGAGATATSGAVAVMASVQQALQTHQVLLPLVHSRPHESHLPQTQHLQLQIHTGSLSPGYHQIIGSEVIPLLGNHDTDENIILIDPSILTGISDYDTFELVYQSEQPSVAAESLTEVKEDDNSNEAQHEHEHEHQSSAQQSENTDDEKYSHVSRGSNDSDRVRTEGKVFVKYEKSRRRKKRNGIVEEFCRPDDEEDVSDEEVEVVGQVEEAEEDEEEEDDDDDVEDGEDFLISEENHSDDDGDNGTEAVDGEVDVEEEEEQNESIGGQLEKRVDHQSHDIDSVYEQGEENIFTNVYEQVDDLNAYLDIALTTKFEDLDIDWTTVCKFCSSEFTNLKDLLRHDCLQSRIPDDGRQYCCTLEGCHETEQSHRAMARHLVLRHYPELNKLTIYGSCPECNTTFSNFTLYNKHSCRRDLRRKLGASLYCKLCNMDFPSHRRYVFHMQFHMTKCRPRVCLICGKNFVKTIDFFKHVQYDHEPLNTLACTKCDRFFTEESNYKSHLKMHRKNDEEQHNCSACSKTFKKKIDLLTHQEFDHPQEFPVKPQKCHDCNREFLNMRTLRNHMKIHQPEIDIYAFMCSECGLVTGDYEVIREHIDGDEWENCREAVICEHLISTVYTCENCNMDYQNVDYLRQHRSSVIHNDQSYKCIFCQREYDVFKTMRNHMKMHKNYESWIESFPITRLYACNIDNCEESYPRWTSLYYHKKRYHSQANLENSRKIEFKCQFCQKQCPTKMSLAIHVARSHNNNNVYCPDCNNAYKDEKALKNHIDLMHVPVQCEICLKFLKNRRNFDTHIRIVHENKQRFFCSECQRGFYHRSELEHHRKYKHPIISFECELCNFETNYEKSYEIHMAKHNNVRNFKCDICEKSFTRKHVLAEHIRRSHVSNEFVCIGDDCGTSFMLMDDLKKHIREEHTDEAAGGDTKPMKLFRLPDVEQRSLLKRSLDTRTTEEKMRSKLIRGEEFPHDDQEEDEDEEEEDEVILTKRNVNGNMNAEEETEEHRNHVGAKIMHCSEEDELEQLLEDSYSEMEMVDVEGGPVRNGVNGTTTIIHLTNNGGRKTMAAARHSRMDEEEVEEEDDDNDEDEKEIEIELEEDANFVEVIDNEENCDDRSNTRTEHTIEI